LPNILDHAAAIGSQGLDTRPFDEIDSLILTQIVYMPMEGFLDQGEQATLAELWDFLRAAHPVGFADPFQQKRRMLLEVCAGLARYRDWVVHSYDHRIDPQQEMQFGVCSFDLPNGRTYIAFRGTDWSLVGWKEDLNMSFMTIPSQRAAVEYTEGMAERTGNALLLGGHSKGGNLAIYAGARVSASVRDQIQHVYSYDGPGMDEETLHCSGYELVSDRIQSFIPQSSVVGMLLHYHPVYTVVRSSSRGILQHDAMTWQVEGGVFVTLPELYLSGKVTDEALHQWLENMEMDTRRALVDTLFQVLSTSQGDRLDGLVLNWQESILRIMGAIRALEPEARKNVRRLLVGLFGVGAASVAKSLLPGFVTRWGTEPDTDGYQDEGSV
jgi:hypothetical protein